MSEFRIEKEREEATLTLANGESVRGFAFVSGASATYAGRERVKDLLNAEPGFFPFEIEGGPAPRTVLYNREHVVLVTLTTDGEPKQDPGYQVAARRAVSLLLSNGMRLNGHIRVYCPKGRDRLSDYARKPERFRYLETPGLTMIFNTRHVVELTENAE